MVRQCELLGISRSSIYRPIGRPGEGLGLLRLIGEHAVLRFALDSSPSPAAKLLGKLQADAAADASARLAGGLYPKPQLSKRHPEHQVYLYLLRGALSTVSTKYEALVYISASTQSTLLFDRYDGLV